MSSRSSLPARSRSKLNSPWTNSGCTTCQVWNELSTNPAYRVQTGVMIQTMGGRAKPLFFRFDLTSRSIHVWRANGNPGFSFGWVECAAICQRYHLGLKAGKIPPIHKLGGTSFFGCPKWKHPALGMINSPFATAVIRHALRMIGLVSCTPSSAVPSRYLIATYPSSQEFF